MLIALDTSTSSASLALVSRADPSQTLAEHNWAIGQRHSVELLPRLERLLAGAGVGFDQLTAVGVATGPGSFNGLRVALATAKSLCLALDLALYGVPTLDLAAWGYAYTSGPLWAMLDAGRGQFYAARYPAGAAAQDWAPIGGYEILTPQEIAARLRDEPEEALLCGEWRPEAHVALQAELAASGARIRFASPLRIRRGVWLAELALARAARGLRDDPAALEPLYVRRPAITTSGKRGIALSSAASTGEALTTRGEASHALHS